MDPSDETNIINKVHRLTQAAEDYGRTHQYGAYRVGRHATHLRQILDRIEIRPTIAGDEDGAD